MPKTEEEGCRPSGVCSPRISVVDLDAVVVQMFGPESLRGGGSIDREDDVS